MHGHSHKPRELYEDHWCVGQSDGWRFLKTTAWTFSLLVVLCSMLFVLIIASGCARDLGLDERAELPADDYWTTIICRPHDEHDCSPPDGEDL